MILSAATSALVTEAALGYSLDLPDWFFCILALAVFFYTVFTVGRVILCFFKKRNSNDSEA